MALNAEVAVAVTLFNQAHSISRCLTSVLEQKVEGTRLCVVLLNDHSTDGWEAEVAPFASRLPLFLVEAECGSAALARNAVLDFVDETFPNVRWVARLDADDRFTDPGSLLAAVRLGDAKHARFVLGGNRLVRAGSLIDRTNAASERLLDSRHVLSILKGMADGDGDNELPSCNLLLSRRCGWRYPAIDSAEDHWLVAQLLLNHPHEGAVLESPFYCDYSLDGGATNNARRKELYRKTREYIYSAARAWTEENQSGDVVLGAGQEGIVMRRGNYVHKRFYPGLIDDQTVARLTVSLQGVAPHLPEPTWQQTGDYWTARYPFVPSEPVTAITASEASLFLRFCLDRGVVCANIKHSNFRRLHSGELAFVDIGKWLLPMNVSYFMDSAARLFALSVLGWPDEELSRRAPRSGPTNGSLEWLPGFADFYGQLVRAHSESYWSASTAKSALSASKGKAEDVTLVIKACAMDAGHLRSQVVHIVEQLSRPRTFAERILAIDPFAGPFLRQHAEPDLGSVRAEAERLRSDGFIDRVLIAPVQPERIAATNQRWFGLACDSSHSVVGIPVTPQLWAFDQVPTRYVLQCDLDILIGRRDLRHDFLADMVDAAQPSDVLGVGFNIPHSATSPPNVYDAPPGDFVPEVRCGLLDLKRIGELLPLPNVVTDGRLTTSWYRSLHEAQRRARRRTLRGGDARSFYVHPTNDRKGDMNQLSRIRDMIGQGQVPDCQLSRWDLSGDDNDWGYAKRAERLVFLSKGRNTPPERLRRWLASLMAQTDQDFGVIVIDDGSDPVSSVTLPEISRSLEPRLTLVRREHPHGRIPNLQFGVRDICTDPETLVAVLDLDDGLIGPAVSSKLKAAQAEGADLVWGAMFRPDKPLKLYHPRPASATQPCAGDVWVHLRAFRKRLFERVPEEAFKLKGEWIAECTDYATMVPMARIAQKPVVIGEYLYFHERTTPRTPEARTRQDEIIRHILARSDAKAF